MCGAKPPLGDLKAYSHRKYFTILRLLLVTSGAPDRLATCTCTCTCTIARVKSSRWVLYQGTLERGDIPGLPIRSPVIHKRMLVSFLKSRGLGMKLGSVTCKKKVGVLLLVTILWCGDCSNEAQT